MPYGSSTSDLMLGGPPPSGGMLGLRAVAMATNHVIGEAILHGHRGECNARRPAGAHHAGAGGESGSNAKILGGEPRVDEAALRHETINILYAQMGVMDGDAGNVSHQADH